MKFVLLTKDKDVVEATKGAFQSDDELLVFEDGAQALDACKDADIIFVDILATLIAPHKVLGYERFAEAKMGHPVAGPIPLVLIAAPDDYEMDFMVGWPDFIFAHLRRPLTYKLFRRATTWV